MSCLLCPLAESSGWVQTGDALVVRDLNHNGTIDSGAQLFGDQTRLARQPLNGRPRGPPCICFR